MKWEWTGRCRAIYQLPCCCPLHRHSLAPASVCAAIFYPSPLLSPSSFLSSLSIIPLPLRFLFLARSLCFMLPFFSLSLHSLIFFSSFLHLCLSAVNAFAFDGVIPHSRVPLLSPPSHSRNIYLGMNRLLFPLFQSMPFLLLPLQLAYHQPTAFLLFLQSSFSISNLPMCVFA